LEVIWLAALLVGGMGSCLAWGCRALAFLGNSHSWTASDRAPQMPWQPLGWDQR